MKVAVIKCWNLLTSLPVVQHFATRDFYSSSSLRQSGVPSYAPPNNELTSLHHTPLIAEIRFPGPSFAAARNMSMIFIDLTESRLCIDD